MLEDLGRERWRVERQGGAGVTEGRDLDLAGRGRRVEPGEKGNVVRNEVDRVRVLAGEGHGLVEPLLLRARAPPGGLAPHRGDALGMAIGESQKWCEHAAVPVERRCACGCHRVALVLGCAPQEEELTGADLGCAEAEADAGQKCEEEVRVVCCQVELELVVVSLRQFQPVLADAEHVAWLEGVALVTEGHFLRHAELRPAQYLSREGEGGRREL